MGRSHLDIKSCRFSAKQQAETLGRKYKGTVLMDNNIHKLWLNFTFDDSPEDFTTGFKMQPRCQLMPLGLLKFLAAQLFSSHRWGFWNFMDRCFNFYRSTSKKTYPRLRYSFTNLLHISVSPQSKSLISSSIPLTTAPPCHPKAKVYLQNILLQILHSMIKRSSNHM